MPTRRTLLKAAAAAVAMVTSGGSGKQSLPTVSRNTPSPSPADLRLPPVAPQGRPVPMIHATDLFRPHCDPDDHWDLASVFALAYTRQIDLKAVLIDFEPHSTNDHNPDVMAVAQMNYVTGLHVPVSVGTPRPMRSRDDSQADAGASDHIGIDMVLDILRRSPEPVVINVIGSCRDIAVAGKKAPQLFAEKCAGIYLNAGTGSPDKEKAAKLEYNVSLAPLSYAAIFDLPCPIYWMPCFEQMNSDRPIMEYGTHYSFRQGEILPHLSSRVQNFFLWMLARKTDHNWLRSLLGPVDPQLLDTFGAQDRHMWCTGGFLHAAGQSILADATNQPAFSFDPIRVTCSDEGVTRWTHDSKAKDRYIFHVRDLDRYQAAMTGALKALLLKLP
ncbi:MAG: twin-arginine translocation signal domain-containing protein [Phycisphaerae bacterium]|nr:twin-arginine translocation signal domain-containing protein [Phycisphaerae bacterium]